MDVIEETIEATLEANGQLQLSHRPRLQPGPVHVTIRATAVAQPMRGLVDVIREIRADQIARGFHGLTTEQLRQREAELEAEDEEYDREMERIGALPPPTVGSN
ncbi:MAG: hypothetical protein Q8K78_02645 [Planctomycetaceae bacterium]|nr:hypothetical protein [Planctomycetaceae bacterium]